MDSNVIVISGRLAGNPILKSYKKADGTEGHRCFFRVAVTRLSDRGQKDRAKRRTNFVPVVAWGEAAKRHAQFLATGTQVTVQGELLCETTRKEDGSFDKEFISVLANDVQYGPRSMKNATPQQLASQVQALQNRIEGLAAGTSEPVAALPTPSAGNPFAEAPASA